jgi:hypothetical protein
MWGVCADPREELLDLRVGQVLRSVATRALWRLRSSDMAFGIVAGCGMARAVSGERTATPQHGRIIPEIVAACGGTA